MSNTLRMADLIDVFNLKWSNINEFIEYQPKSIHHLQKKKE